MDQFSDPFGSRTTNTLTNVYGMTTPEEPPWYSLFYTTDMLKKPQNPHGASPPAVQKVLAQQAKIDPSPQVANAATTGQANVSNFKSSGFSHNMTNDRLFQMLQMQSLNNTINLLLLFIFILVMTCIGILMVRRSDTPTILTTGRGEPIIQIP